MNEQAFDIFLLTTAALVLNLVVLVFMTGGRRVKTKTFTNPEDAEAFKGNAADAEDPSVARVRAAHSNALQNIPLFLILAYLHVLTGASETSAIAYFATFVLARWLHSFAYIRALQPWRTISFTVSFFVIVGLTIRLVMTALT